MTARVCVTPRALVRRLGRSRRGVAFLEFALALPLVLGFALAGMEMCNYVLANNKVQRMAAMTADLVAQSGVGEVGATESQIYDLFYALDVSARPFDLRKQGRVVITAVKGTDNNNDGVVENRIMWQRFDGGYVAAPIVLGCGTTTTYATLPHKRVMTLNEMLFHVQVTYRYKPLFVARAFDMLHLPDAFTRVAVYRARNTDFEAPTPVTGRPPKKNCNTANGL